ncbi:MAG: alpha/beta hydrolase [Pseudomonadota bacterium]
MNVAVKISLAARHQSSGNSVRCAAGELDFAQYVARSKLALGRVHAGKVGLEKIVAGNAPFELHPAGNFQTGRDKPYRRGVLLTHGLSDSPYHLRHLAAFFRQNGFRVMAVLLPGHGTQPGDLLDVHWREWVETVACGVECLAAEVDELYLAGLSTGAALSVYHAARDGRVRALFLFSPAFEITSRARWAHLHRLYSWLCPVAAWVDVMPDRDLYKYESFCKNAAAQVYALLKSLPQSAVAIPVFAAASADDATVHAAATLRFMRRAVHSCSRLLWYARDKIEQPKVTWVDSVLPQQRILGSAHTAIVMSPDDPHYGAAGGYANCLHYYPHDMDSYAACVARRQDAWLGEVNEQNLRRGLLQRLTYNPHYAAMEAAMQHFIGELP